MINIIRKLFSEPDNETPCPVRIATGLTNIVYHVAAMFGIYLGILHLDISTLGMYLQHMATLIGVGSISIGTKSIMKGDAAP